jgi:YidC/Oxa1 family membrane protein insertase
MAPPKGQFTGPAIFTAPPSTEKAPSVATGEVILAPDAEGRFAFEIYAGPQQWRRLVALGHGLEHANPYGGFLRAVVQPFATFVMTVLLWMHDKLQLNYGWVLVIFGVGIRLLLWPLNQSAMRSSLRMQRIQPELQALQAKYKANPEKMQAEYMKLLKDNGMTPFSQFTGCLPMLIPMPVLFALFFVFQNTIEFRGVSFLWLADISQKDPYYILPVAMGLSMFLLSWIGLRNSPPNPQAKMFGYMMPAMMTVFFLNFPAGLNLYYAVQNLAALPQQWLIAKERAKNPPRPPSS